MSSPPADPISATPSLAVVPWWRRAARWLWLVAVLAVLAVVLRERGGDVLDAFGRLSPIALTGSLAAVGAAVGVSGELWRGLVAGLGSRLPRRTALRVFFVSQLGKYLPGSLWPVLAQMELGRDAGVPGRVSAAGFAVFMAAYLLWGAAVGAVALAVTGLGEWWWALLAPVAAALWLPPVLRLVLGWGMRLARRQALPAVPGGRALGAAALRALVMWALTGLHLWLLARGMGVSLGVVAAIGVYAASWVAGFVVVVAPAGAGVREAAMVALLAPVTDTATALALALLSRALGTVADAGWGLLGLARRP